MRFNTVQILRFSAAAAVLLYHAHFYVGELVWKTWLTRLADDHFAWGVQLFFVISGFVVSHSLSQQTPGRFLVHRLIRIYPALWLASCAVLAFRMLAGAAPPDPTGVLLAFSLIQTSRSEFQLGGVEWTLVYEVFFYTVLAAVGCLRWRRAREWAMVAWASAIGAAAVFTSLNATSFTPAPATIVLSGFDLPFIAGVLAYSWFRSDQRLPVVSLLAVVPVALYAAHRVDVVVASLAFRSAGFGALVLVAAERARRRDASPSNPLVKLGDWSYALYLVHVPVVVAVARQFAGRPELAHLCFVVALALALVTGIVCGAVETRMYRYAKRALDATWRVKPAAA